MAGSASAGTASGKASAVHSPPRIALPQRCPRIFKAPLLLLAAAFTCAASHDLNETVKPINITKLRLTSERPRVLLFLHYVKCGGSTVRGLFHSRGWASTYWSLSQRFSGWKANRLLHSIRLELLKNKTRIFAEWHLGIEITSVPLIRKYVLMMRPDVEFVAFTIVRDPVRLVGSAGAYFQPPTFPPALWIYSQYEVLISHLGVNTTDRVSELAVAEGDRSNVSDATCATLCEKERSMCTIATKHLAKTKQVNISLEVELTAARTWLLPHAEQQAFLTRIGCAPLIEEAMQRLSVLDHVLLLEDPQTMQTMARLAEWRPADGQLPFSRSNDTTDYKIPQKASASLDRTKRHVVAEYASAPMRAAASKMNNCSSRLYRQLRAAAAFDGGGAA